MINESIQIVRGRWLMQDAQRVWDNGALVISAGHIEQVGSWPEIRDKFPEAPVFGSDQHAIIPGLINAHHHSNGVTALQHGLPDQLLELWLLSLAQRRSSSIELATLLSAARLLRTGVTSVVDVYSGRGTADEFRDSLQLALSAYDQAGIRVAFAAGISEQSYLAWGEDESFLRTLPADARALAAHRLPTHDALDIEDYFAIMDQFQAHYREHSRIAVWFGPPGPQWVSDRTMQRMAERALVHDVGIQTHLLESLYEKHHGLRSYGQATVLHLQELGVLSHRFSVAHGVWLTENEIAVLAESGAHVSHNPSSNLRLRAGIAPLNAMLAAGLNVGLGMDGTTLNDDEDMFTEMRLALNLHRTPTVGGPAPAIEQLWQLATAGGAQLFQAGGQVGKLLPGYAADVVLLRLDRLTWPWVSPEADPRLLLLTRAQARDVETVFVEGKIVLADGVPTGIDLSAVAEELATVLETTPLSADAARLVQALTPYVAGYYQGWPLHELQPYDARNSRN